MKGGRRKAGDVDRKLANSQRKPQEGGRRFALHPPISVPGFTLLEMLIGLAIGALIIGSVMGVISEALRYKVNLKEKASIQPVLESAAQIILADPAKALKGIVRLTEIEDSPEVGVNLAPVPLDENSAGGGKFGRLYRVMLTYRSATLELSMIIPNQK